MPADVRDGNDDVLVIGLGNSAVPICELCVMRR
jgi:hypothetical protein